jgi:hypothetical protein
MKKFLLVALLALAVLTAPVHAQRVQYNGTARYSNTWDAANFGKWQLRVASGSTSTGAYSITFPAGGYVTTTQGQSFTPFNTTTRITVGTGATQETVTPSAVSNCGVSSVATCTVTATFTYAHGAGTPVISGSGGFDEAANVATVNGGGPIFVSNNTSITDALMNASKAVFNNVTVLSMVHGTMQPWSPTPTGLALAVPSGVPVTGQAACDATHQACSDANVVGSASWGSTVYVAVTYMDCFGNEGPASATTNWTSVASKAIDIATPVTGNTGACGWVPYLSLSGGTYALAYQIPPTSSVCTLSKLTPIPSCSLTSTYGADALFTGGAQITTYPVSTAMTYPILATTAATITAQHPMTNSSLTYAYAPGNRMGQCGLTSANMVQTSAAGGINGSSATTVPNPMVSWSLPANCLNYIGAEFRVTGKWTYTDGGDTSTHLVVSWDANGTNTASVPTKLCDVLDTATGTGAAYNGTWTCTVKVLTVGATGTALVNGYSTQNLAAGATTLVRNGADIAVAASGSINLTTNARISVWFEGIGATNNPGAQALDASLEFLN